jgi:hypothetical protein
MLRFPKANRTIFDKGHAVGLPGLRRSTGVLWLQSPLSSFHVNANGRGFPSLRFDHSQGTVPPKHEVLGSLFLFAGESLPLSTRSLNLGVQLCRRGRTLNHSRTKLWALDAS